MRKITDLSVHASIELPNKVYLKKCLSLIAEIMNDHSHPIPKYIIVLPHGQLQTVKCRAERFCKTFLPEEIKLYDSK